MTFGLRPGPKLIGLAWLAVAVRRDRGVGSSAAGRVRGVREIIAEHRSREDLALASQQADPVAVLLAMARGHAVLCRRDIARVAMALRV
ncbi:MAG: hypothetical protein ACRDNK_11190, partial [Solirubrobacteraceae bacterium]